ncbi:Prefoldin alpha-like protein [Suillus spraguei]|nr:Prefoldin alpha-like protein [Suillus spraguei]
MLLISTSQQLSDVRRQLEELKQAQAKFKSCIENVGEVKPQNKGTTILVPLTNSLYVPGHLSDAENVIVDVGTGYYVKKSRAQATKYYETKVEYIRTNLDTLQETIQKKQENMTYLVNVMQAKLQQSQAQPTKV